METFEVELNAVLHYDMAISLRKPWSKMLERKWPPKGVVLLGSIALLEKMCHCEGRL